MTRKSLLCRFGKHKWGEWRSVSYHYERCCLRCGEKQLKFTSLKIVLARLVVDLLEKNIDYKARRLPLINGQREIDWGKIK